MTSEQFVKDAPELLKQGIEIYKMLKEDMQRALGLKQYAEHLSHITQIMKEVNNLLDEKEKEIVQKLSEAYSLSEAGMDKAVVVVSVIKEQGTILAQLLSRSGPGSDQEKLFAACASFSAFAKDVEGKLTEAEDALRAASEKLFSTQSNIGSIVHTLERVHEGFIAEKKKAMAEQRAAAYGGAAVGLIFGPIGLMISYAIAASVTEGLHIPEIEADFQRQRDTIANYIEGFDQMHSETKTLSEAFKTKRNQLLKIHGKLDAAGSLAGQDQLIRTIPLIYLPNIRKNADDLVAACEEFLKTSDQ